MQTDKYYVLSVLRDIFVKFKELGDEELDYYHGSCLSCPKNENKTVHVFEGKNSQQQFGFIPSRYSEKMGLHFCVAFTDKTGRKSQKCGQFFLLAAMKLAEFQKRGIE